MNEFSQQTDEIEKWETFQGIREQPLKEQTQTFRIIEPNHQFTPRHHSRQFENELF